MIVKHHETSELTSILVMQLRAKPKEEVNHIIIFKKKRSWYEQESL